MGAQIARAPSRSSGSCDCPSRTRSRAPPGPLVTHGERDTSRREEARHPVEARLAVDEAKVVGPAVERLEGRADLSGTRREVLVEELLPRLPCTSAVRVTTPSRSKITASQRGKSRSPGLGRFATHAGRASRHRAPMYAAYRVGTNAPRAARGQPSAQAYPDGVSSTGYVHGYGTPEQRAARLAGGALAAPADPDGTTSSPGPGCSRSAAASVRCWRCSGRSSPAPTRRRRHRAEAARLRPRTPGAGRGRGDPRRGGCTRASVRRRVVRLRLDDVVPGARRRPGRRPPRSPASPRSRRRHHRDRGRLLDLPGRAVHAGDRGVDPRDGRGDGGIGLERRRHASAGVAPQAGFREVDEGERPFWWQNDDLAGQASYAADVIESALDALAQLPGAAEEELRAGLPTCARCRASRAQASAGSCTSRRRFASS